MHNVRPLPLNDKNFIKRLRAIAHNSSMVIITCHARSRMIERGIAIKQVFDCLRKGYLVEPAHLNINGHWKSTLEIHSSGDIVQVAVVLENRGNGDCAIVVTVIGKQR